MDLLEEKKSGELFEKFISSKKETLKKISFSKINWKKLKLVCIKESQWIYVPICPTQYLCQCYYIVV